MEWRGWDRSEKRQKKRGLERGPRWFLLNCLVFFVCFLLNDVEHVLMLFFYFFDGFWRVFVGFVFTCSGLFAVFDGSF